MTTINTLRDRLLLRLLSKTSRDALSQVVFYDVEAQIDHFKVNPEACNHIAVPMCRLADLIEKKPQWTAQLTENN